MAAATAAVTATATAVTQTPYGGPLPFTDGLALWLDAADAGTLFQDSGGTIPVTSNGQTIGQWRDKSGNGRNAITSTGSVVLSSGQINAIRPILFGNASALAVPTNVSQPQTSVFAVARGIGSSPSSGYGYGFFSLTSSGATGSNQLFASYYLPTGAFANSYYLVVVKSGAERDYGGISPTNPFLGNSFIATILGNSGGLLNGAQVPIDTRINNGNPTNTSLNTVQSGRIGFARGDFLSFELGELIVIDGIPTNIQRQQVEGYLAWKWGLQNSLPAPHPYRNTAYISAQIQTWQPSQLGGLGLWLDAADSNTVTVSPGTSNVTAWRDKSASNITMSYNTGTVLYNRTGYNGLPTITLGSGISGFIYNTPFNLSYTNSLSIYIVSRTTFTSGDGRILSFTRVNDYTPPGFGVIVNNNTIQYNGNNIFLGTTFLSNTNGFASIILNGNLSINPAVPLNTAGIRVNGNIFNTTSATIATLASDYTFRIGRWANPGIEFFNGNISEILMFTRPLNVTENQQVEGYLAWKWGLQNSLPTTHPYYTAFTTGTPLIPVPNPQRIIQAPFWQPTQFDGLAMWLDAADATTVTLSNAAVTQWRDKSSGTQGTAVGTPSYANNSNGNFIRISGTQYFNYGTSLFNIGLEPFSVFTVARNNVQSGQGAIFGRRNTVSPFTPSLSLFYNGASIQTTYNSGANLINFGGTNTSNVHQFAYTVTRNPSDSTTLLYQNGTQQGTAQTGVLTSSAGAYSLIIGSLSATTFPLQGDIFEFIAYIGTPTTIQRQQVEGYLAWKWGLQGSLPSTHPYFRTPLLSTALLPIPLNIPIRWTRAASWSPTAFSGLALWLDAADAGAVVLSNAAVTQWNNKSGIGSNASASGTILVGTINNLPAMSYSGSTSTFFRGSLSYTSSSITVFSVFLMNNAGTYVVARVVSLAAVGVFDYNNTAYTSAIQRNINTLVAYRNNANLGTFTNFTFGVPVFACSVFNGATHTIFVNGTAGTTVNSSGNFGYSAYVIGSSSGEENLVPYSGLIGEVLIYHTALTTTQRQQVEGYLAWKWGLQGNLPASHPNRFIPP